MLVFDRMLRAAVLIAAGALSTAPSCGSAGTGGSPPVQSPAAPSPASGWTLAWSDEFDGPAGAPADSARWVADIGGNGWGNHELEYYTARSANVSLSGDGFLVIQALREHYQGEDGVARDYTSARLKTQGRFEQTYGRFEARLKIPRGQGLWPAFWMLGADIAASGWPRCGEIDVMENIGREPATVHGSMHGPGYSGAAGLTAGYTLPGGAVVADDYHVFAAEWEPATVRFYVDGSLYQTRTPADLGTGQGWVFDHPFFILLNVAVGGDWPGSPDTSTVFPQAMLVDYVRVYRRAGPSGEATS